jgi:collagen beta-1,O-galactosyltransferase
VLVLEDDIRFEPHFLTKMQDLIQELSQDRPGWDLVYVGRKIMRDANEPWLEGSSRLVRVDYTYWTLAYLLRLSGAVKLVGAAPLSKMVPVDEYLPIMYDRHPNDTWKECFPDRTLEAFSVHPLLVHPTHYVGQEGYSSDTEATQQIGLEEVKQAKDEL